MPCKHIPHRGPSQVQVCLHYQIIFIRWHNRYEPPLLLTWSEYVDFTRCLYSCYALFDVPLNSSLWFHGMLMLLSSLFAHYLPQRIPRPPRSIHLAFHSTSRPGIVKPPHKSRDDLAFSLPQRQLCPHLLDGREIVLKISSALSDLRKHS